MKPNPRSTIFSNGLILISVPLFFEVAFAGTLFYLQQDYEQKLQRQIHANQVVSHTNEMWLAVMDMVTSTFATKVFPDKRLATRFSVHKIDDEYDDLQKLLKNEPSHIPSLYRLNAQAKALLKSSNQFADPNLSDGIVGLRGNMVQFYHVKRNIKALGDEMVRFREPWQRRTEESAKDIEEARRLIAIVTLGGVGISVILAGILFAFFMQNIYEGIRRLMGNTVRFAEKKPLLAPSSGGDELAQLDRTFHEMAQSVEAASLEQERLQQLKQDFYQMVTHDMRTPLSSMVLSLDSIVSGLAGDISDEAMPSLKRTQANADILMNLINDMLQLETAETEGINLEIEEFEAQEAIDEVVQSLDSIAKRASVTLRVDCAPTEIYADRIRLIRVLTNLVGNAIKFSPQNSQVDIKARTQDNRFCVDIIDHGRGVPEEFRDSIFDKFKQVETNDARKKKGSGLGLAIAKAFVEAHGGKIGVESNEKDGSRFWFWLPQDPTSNVTS